LTLEHNRAFHIGFLRRSDVVPDLGFDHAAGNVDRTWDMPGCIFLRLTDIDDQGWSRILDDLSILFHTDGFDRFRCDLNVLFDGRWEALSESGRRYGQGGADEGRDETEG
jgi:hypothetical protein